MRFSVRNPMVRARRKSYLNDTKQSNIWYVVHVRIIKNVSAFVFFNDFDLAEHLS